MYSGQERVKRNLSVFLVNDLVRSFTLHSDYSKVRLLCLTSSTAVNTLAYDVTQQSTPDGAVRVRTEQNTVRVSTEQNTVRVSTEQNTVRVSTEQNTVRVRPEQNTVRVSTEQNTVRVSAEQNTVRVSTEQNIVRVSTEQNTVRVRPEQNTVRVSTEQNTVCVRTVKEQNAASGQRGYSDPGRPSAHVRGASSLAIYQATQQSSRAGQ